MIPKLNERGEQKKNEKGIPIFVKTKADEELTEIRKPDVSGDTEPITSIQEPKTNTTTTTEANDIDDT